MKIFLIAVLIFISHLSFSQTPKKIKATELEQLIAESKTPLIINFWATFCVPCIQEIPYFQEEVKKYAKDSIRLILVSLDLTDYYPAKLKAFAIKKKFTAPVYWLDEHDADYFCPKVDPKWSGAIPASLFINNKTGYRRFLEEQVSRPKLVKEIAALRGM